MRSKVRSIDQDISKNCWEQRF